MKFNVFNARIGIKLDGLESRNTSLLAHGVGAHLDKEPLMSFISAGPADRLENLKPKRVTLNDTEILLIRDGEVLVDPEQATDSTDKRQNRLTAVNAHSHIVIVGAGAAGAAAL